MHQYVYWLIWASWTNNFESWVLSPWDD